MKPRPYLVKTAAFGGNVNVRTFDSLKDAKDFIKERGPVHWARGDSHIYKLVK